MITRLEEDFFECFGIERKRNDKVTLEAISGGVRSANLSQEPFYVYPQITDHILLELICILHKYSNRSCLLVRPYGENIEQLKKETLTSLVIFYGNTLKHQKSIYREVHALFEEYKQ